MPEKLVTSSEWAGFYQTRKRTKRTAVGAVCIFATLLVIDLVSWPRHSQNLTLLRLALYIGVVLASLLVLTWAIQGCLERRHLLCPVCKGSYAGFWTISMRRCRSCKVVPPAARLGWISSRTKMLFLLLVISGGYITYVIGKEMEERRPCETAMMMEAFALQEGMVGTSPHPCWIVDRPLPVSYKVMAWLLMFSVAATPVSLAFDWRKCSKLRAFI